MATQAPAPPAKKPAAEPARPKRPLPDEGSWKRYSQHGEAPLSGAGSLGLHVLALAVIFIVGFGLFREKKRSDLPVEPIKVGGKGTGRGEGIGNKAGDGVDTEDGAGRGDGSQEKGPIDDGPLKLKPEEIAALPIDIKNDQDAMRAFQKGHPNARVFSQLSDTAREKFRSGLNPGGNGGQGTGGTVGGTSGDGPGKGSGRSLNDREKRMYRWRINFPRTSPREYLGQLSAMGAIIGVPVDRDNYKMIKDLSVSPAKVLDDDPSKLGLIYWFNNDPLWTTDVLRELGVGIQASHFVVFFPVSLEEELAKAEHAAAKGLKENQIEETQFILVRQGNKLVPRVQSVKRK
jgi:hypothetical protein